MDLLKNTNQICFMLCWIYKCTCAQYVLINKCFLHNKWKLYKLTIVNIQCTYIYYILCCFFRTTMWRCAWGVRINSPPWNGDTTVEHAARYVLLTPPWNGDTTVEHAARYVSLTVWTETPLSSMRQGMFG